MAEANTRPNRAEETRRARRRQPGKLANTGMKLTVDEEKLDRKNFEYRFVRDTGGRVQQLAGQDYDPVLDDGAKPDSSGVGVTPTVHGGTDEQGKPYGMVLMRKHRDWFEADQKEKQRPLDEMDEAIRRGANKTELTGDGTYTPGGSNTIERA